jgi:hypothetical protein
MLVKKIVENLAQTIFLLCNFFRLCSFQKFAQRKKIAQIKTIHPIRSLWGRCYGYTNSAILGEKLALFSKANVICV